MFKAITTQWTTSGGLAVLTALLMVSGMAMAGVGTVAADEIEAVYVNEESISKGGGTTYDTGLFEVESGSLDVFVEFSEVDFAEIDVILNDADAEEVEHLGTVTDEDGFSTDFESSVDYVDSGEYSLVLDETNGEGMWTVDEIWVDNIVQDDGDDEGDVEVTFTVEDEEGDPIEDATVDLDGDEGTTGSDGSVTYTDLEDGEYVVNADADSYEDAEETVTINGEDKEVTLVLDEKEGTGENGDDESDEDGDEAGGGGSGDDGVGSDEIILISAFVTILFGFLALVTWAAKQ
ncbi:carboxypeptidase-like regulatory domain-containing protein [Natronobeatus ordinarius]|uniref:carboxypeptidase-like regulatory domain-containing protein n=1 Tax=Natronobeatus ordinarius TaxID=2963433 RepID=UPI0020CF679A|nr:carboxypeptidase-like regulatory domain-containing protein [Natronobeatus ordinarius]